MVSCTTTTTLNGQKTSNCRGTIATTIYNHFFDANGVTTRKIRAVAGDIDTKTIPAKIVSIAVNTDKILIIIKKLK